MGNGVSGCSLQHSKDSPCGHKAEDAEDDEVASPVSTKDNDQPALIKVPSAKDPAEYPEREVPAARSVQSEALDVERRRWAEEEEEKSRVSKLAKLEAQIENTRQSMTVDPSRLVGTHRAANRYGPLAQLPPFQAGTHVPVLGLINDRSGAQAGHDILAVARASPYYKTRMFNIIDVIKDRQPGGMLDVFRIELLRAKEEAKKMSTRARLISGGGDGTGSFALFILFLALRADPERVDEGLGDRGNGFIWTDEEMANHLPAIAQMPLGSANDFANILGWGQKYPGDGCLKPNNAAGMLNKWFEAVIDPSSDVVSFDLWGIMPHKGSEVDFKLAELEGKRGTCPLLEKEGKRMVHLKEAGNPVPFFVCLYFSAGFGAYMTARFQLNRHNLPIKNRAEYIRQGLGIMKETTPPQIPVRLTDVEIDCENEAYFPPRRDQGTNGRSYREVGFYNINWQAHAFHGADRASASARVCACVGGAPREPVLFNDGRIDMFRWKFMSVLKNPGLKVQTDKKKDMHLRYKGAKGTGIFFQWDGEARFAFSPSGEDINIYIRKIMNIPVVLGPHYSAKLVGDVRRGEPVTFEWGGDTAEDQAAVRERTIKYINGELDAELNANAEQIKTADFPTLLVQDP